LLRQEREALHAVKTVFTVEDLVLELLGGIEDVIDFLHSRKARAAGLDRGRWPEPR